MQESEPSSIEDSNPEAEDVDRFEKSLRELRELRSQLHYAAEYCENAFLNSKQKQKVMKSTKDYISNAMVTVVDHLGSASANLECLISCRVDPTHAEFRINGLQHRLLTCREYGRKQDLANVRWSAKFPTYHAHYTSRLTPNLQRPKALVRNAADLVAVGPTNESKIEANGSAPLVRFTESTLAIKNLNSRLSSGFEFSAAALPAKDTSSVLSKPRIPSFRSHAKWIKRGAHLFCAAYTFPGENPPSEGILFHALISSRGGAKVIRTDPGRLGCHDQSKKGVQGNNFLPFLRRSKRAA